VAGTAVDDDIAATQRQESVVTPEPVNGAVDAVAEQPIRLAIAAEVPPPTEPSTSSMPVIE
jgi:hypothetical protein